MNLLDKAKGLLCGDTTIVVINGESVTTSTQKGISALLGYAESGVLNGATVADKIVGKAAALLMVYGKAKKVFGAVITKEAIQVFEKYNIACSYAVVCDKISNRNGTDICPMEQAVADINEPKDALTAISLKITSL